MHRKEIILIPNGEADQDFQTVKIQLKAYQLIELNMPSMIIGNPLCWGLTEKGEYTMMQLRAVRKVN